MVEAGADEVPEDDAARGPRARARGDQASSATRRRSCASRSASRSGSTPSSPPRSSRAHGARDPRAHRGGRPPRGRRDRRGARGRARPRDLDGLDRGGHPAPAPGPLEPRAAPRAAAAGGRRGRGARPVRGRPEGAHRGRAGLEGAQVGEALAALRPDHRGRRAAVPGRAGQRRRRGRDVKDSITKSYVKKAAEAIYKDLVRKKIAVEKRRPDGRGSEDIRPITVEVGAQPAHARLRPVHARPDADAQLAHARHRQGGPADRRPLAGAGPPLHAPLQLPALLGRGDGLHARPEAARHRPRRARTAGAPGDDPVDRGLPVHDPHRLRDARVERLVVDGPRCAARRSR